MARVASAIVRSEMRQGKGNVVRRMFADIEADIYILVDGDDTYDATAAPVFLRKLVDDGLDVVSGRRIVVGGSAYRTGHVIGNRLLMGLTVRMFRLKVLDLLTGYRVMSRRFVKSFPVTAQGFSIVLMLLSIGLGAPVVLEYLKTGLVPRLPTAVLSTGLMVLAFLSLASGLILDTVTRGRWELKRLAYLAVKNPHDLKLR